MKRFKKHIRILCVILVLAFAIFVNIPSAVLAAAGDETTTGAITLTPTIECIGVIARFTGDNNQNNTVTLEYRVSGGAWKTGMVMYIDRQATIDIGGSATANPLVKTARGSVLGLTANTAYEVRVTFSDANGITGTNPVSGTTTTRNDNPAIGTHYYYVSPTGNDTNTGLDETHPFRTIQKAANTVNPGDTVLVRAGTYTGVTTVSRSGTISSYITFMNYVSEQVILEGSGTTTNLFDISASYIRIKGFTVQNTSYSNDGGALRLNGGSYCIIEDNTILNPLGKGAIMIRSGSGNTLVQRNTISVTRQVTGANQQPSGVYWWKAGGANVFRNNTLTSTTIWGMWDGFGGGPENELGYMSDCDFYNNTITYTTAVDPADYWDRDDGIQVDGELVNERVWNNRIENTLVGFSACPNEMGPLYVFRNVFYNTTGELYKLGDNTNGPTYFYHNTYYNTNAGDGYKQTNAGVGHYIGRNNIVYAGRYVIEFNSGDEDSIDFDYDNFYTTDSTRFIECFGRWMNLADYAASSGDETHGISVPDNKFVNAATGDLRLQSSSPDVDHGVIIPGFNDANSLWPFQGTAPDIGAYEYASGAPVNQPPVLAAIGNKTVAGGQALTFTVSATDPNGDTLTYSASNLPSGCAFTAATRTFAWTSASAGTYNNVHFQVSDGSLTDSEDISITVTVAGANQAPAAVNDSYSTNKNISLTVAAPGLLANDTDVDSATLTAVKVTNPPHGSVTINTNGSFTYTPTTDYTGSDSFTYKANDGALDSNTATVSITITAATVSATFGLNSGNGNYNESGSCIDAMRFQNTSGAGTLAKLEILFDDTTPTGSVRLGVYADNNGVPGARLLDAGTVNAANGWVSISGLNMPVTANTYYWLAFNMQNTNIVRTQTGLAANSHYWSDSAYAALPSSFPKASGSESMNFGMRATVSQTAVNTAPLATDDSYTSSEDTIYNLAATGVLSNDMDADGNPLTAVKVTNPSHGTVTLNSNGSLTYTPAANYNGADSFTYKVNDGTVDSNTATVTITVTAVNDLPVAVNDSYSVSKNALLTVAAPGLLGNDTGIDSAIITAILVGNPSHGSVTVNTNGSFTYTPPTDYTGSDSFTYKANNGALDSNTAAVTITIVAVNRAPVATNDSYTTPEDTVFNLAAPGVLSNDTDADGNPLTAVKVTNPAHGTVTVNTNGSFTYTPTTDYTGSDSFTYKANDGTVDSNTATVSITITASASATFGLNSGNSKYNESGSCIDAMRFQNTSGTGTLTKLEILFDDTTPNGSVRLGVYADNNGVPGARLLDAGTVKVANGWVSISGLNLPVTANTYYWLAFNMQNFNYVKTQTGLGANSHYWSNSSYAALPSSFPKVTGSESMNYVMRATIVPR